MSQSPRVWVRAVLCASLVASFVGACGSTDDKRVPRTVRDSEDGGDGTTHPASGGSTAVAGDGQGANGALTGGGVGPGAAGEQALGGDGALGGATAAAGAAGGTATDVDPTVYVEDLARGTTGPLVFQITTAQSPAIVGQHFAYTVTVSNTSDVAAPGVNVLARMSEGLQFGYALDASPDAAYCSGNVCNPGDEATWAVGSIPARSSQTILINPTVLNTVGNGDNVTPLFRLSATGVDTLNLTKTTPVQTSAPTELTLAVSADPVVPGQLVEMSVDVGQIGATPLVGAELRVALPSGLLLESASDGGEEVDGEVVWAIGGVPVGTTLHRSLSLKVHPRAVPGDVLNPRATLAFTGGLDPDNVAQIPLSVVPEKPSLSLTVTAANSPAIPTGDLLYEVTVANTALRAIDNVLLGLVVPQELSFGYALDAEPNSAYCSGNVCSPDEEVSWDLGTLESGASQTISIRAYVDANAAGDGTLVTPVFVVRAPGENQLNLLKTLPVFSKPAAQLVLGTPVSPVTPGQDFSYDLDIGQVGATALNATQLQLILPDTVNFSSASDGGVSDAGTVTWDLGKIAVAGFAHRTVTVNAAADLVAGTTLFARAKLMYTGGAEVDNVSELGVSVVTDPLPLSVTFGATPSPATTGAVMTYTTTIKNDAARAVDLVQLLLRSPDFSFGYATSSDPDAAYCSGNVCSPAEEAVWALGTIKAGASSIVIFNPTVTPALLGGSLLTARQRLTATALGGTIRLQKTVPTQSP